jgi:hypothetical protein
METAPNNSMYQRGPWPLLLAAALLCLVAMAVTAPLAQARKMSMTYVTLLGPASATNPIGANYTVTATLMRHTQNCDPNGSTQIGPASGKTVKFTVLSGPNQGMTDTDVTDAQGHAQFTYTSATVGTDTIVAVPVGLNNTGVCNPDGGPAQPSKKVTATWVDNGRGGDPAPGPGEGSPHITISDARVIEGNTDLSPATPLTFTVSLSQPVAVPVAVEYGTVNWSAINPADYLGTKGKLTFAPGDPLTQKVKIAVRGDHWDEPNEWLLVVLSNPMNAQIADPVGIGTIIDDDDPIMTG